ncbi:MAG: hypothetical protein NTU70_05545 [Methylococcales bacterium]|nr:hypothetical protein [Methylococcales bacterium]
MSNRFTEIEIKQLYLLGRMLASTRNFATSNLNKSGKNHLFMMLDAAHNIPGALIDPEHYNIESDVARLKELLDRMNDPIFLKKNSADENKAWTIDALKAVYSNSIRNEESILKSNLCGCFHCISIFPVADIKEMTVEKDGCKTAVCPICGIDAVLGDASVEITAELIESMNEYYF